MVSEINAALYERLNEGRNQWNRFDENFYTAHLGIVLRDTSFCFRMLKNVVDRLIDAGVVIYLTDPQIVVKTKFPKYESEPNVLYVDDLMFGFTIWLGFCAFSGIVFVAELILGIKFCRKKFNFDYFWKKFKYKKLKFAKVHQSLDQKCSSCYKNQKLTSKTLKSFRIKKPEPKVEENMNCTSTVKAVVHHRMNSELELRALGTKVKEDQNDLLLESESSNISKELSQFEQTMELICLEMKNLKDVEDFADCESKKNKIPPEADF